MMKNPSQQYKPDRQQDNRRKLPQSKEWHTHKDTSTKKYQIDKTIEETPHGI